MSFTFLRCGIRYALSVAFSLVALVSIMPQVSVAQKSNIETSFVSDDSNLVVRFDIEKVRSAVPMDSPDLDVIAKTLKKEVGMDVMTMKAITIQFGKENERDPSFSITFEHTKPIDRNAFHEVGEFPLDEYTETELAGKKYMRNEDDGGPHLYFTNDKTFTMATAAAVESVVKASSGKGKMSGLLRSSPPGSEIMIAFQSAEGFDVFSELLSELSIIDLPFDLNEILPSIESGLGHVKLNSSTPVFLQLTSKSNESANEVKSMLSDLIKYGKSALPLGKMIVDNGLKEFEDGGGREGLKPEKDAYELAAKAIVTAEKVLVGAKATANDNVATLKVNHMGGLKEIAPLAVGGMKILFVGKGGGHDLELGPGEKAKAIKDIK